MRWLSVTSGKDLFNAEGYNCFYKVGPTTRTGSKWDGCATKNFVGLGASFTPTWYQVLPGVDLSAPMTYSVGIKGNAATVFGGNQGTGNFSLGLGANVYQKYFVDLKYIGYFGTINDYGTGAVISQNGFTTLLKDRNFVSLTLKTSF